MYDESIQRVSYQDTPAVHEVLLALFNATLGYDEFAEIEHPTLNSDVFFTSIWCYSMNNVTQCNTATIIREKYRLRGLALSHLECAQRGREHDHRWTETYCRTESGHIHLKMHQAGDKNIAGHTHHDRS